MFSKLLHATRGFVFLGLLTSASTAAAQEYYDYYDGKRVELHAATDKLVVKFANPETALRRSKALTGLQRLSAVQDFELTSIPGIAFVNLRGSATKAAAAQALKAISQEADIVSSSPVLLTESGQAMGAYTDEVVVALKSAQAKAGMLALAERLGAKIARAYEFDALTFILSVDKKRGTALTVANQLTEAGVVKYAQPNYLLYIGKTTSDPHYSQQWALENTGSNSSPTGVAGADIKAYQAWQATYWNSGNGIKVAIVDDGVDLTHPDLAAALNPGYDAMGGGTDGAPDPYDAHGTACAGEVVAIPNNNIGVAGVAYNSKVVPVRVYTDFSSAYDLTIASYCAGGIDWAWQGNRADIISCSWKVYVGQNLIADAIHRAVTQGRNYSGTPLGCVVLAAAGNDDSVLNFPGSLSDVVSVGATSMCDQRKSPTSCDNETWWGSNYGTGLDVVAPGVKIYTTDIHDAGGYNNAAGAAGDYIDNFNGTSSATPYASAVTALILCSNTSLTQRQARSILEASANKVGGYSYTMGSGERADLTWNAEMGYGRINAYDAVMLARSCGTAAPGPISGYYSPGVGTLDVSIAPVPNATSYNWYKNGQMSFGHGNTNTWRGPRNECGSPVVEVEAVFACGPSSRTSRTFPGLTTGCQGEEVERTASTTAYPNPATETILLPAGTSEATLLNARGLPVRQVDKAGSINVQDLPQGLYNLQMWQNGKVINQRIQVEH